MGTVSLRKSLPLVLVLIIMATMIGCTGHKTGKHKAAPVTGEEAETEPLLARIVVKDLITSSGNAGEPAAYIVIRKGDWINFKGDVSGGTPPYTYNWDFDDVTPDLKVKDPGNIEYINVTGSGYGVAYTVEFTVTDQNGEQSVDSIQVLVFND